MPVIARTSFVMAIISITCDARLSLMFVAELVPKQRRTESVVRTTFAEKRRD